MGLSPMMTHYMQLKEKYKDCIVFYRLGDFYEMFFDDAVKASSLLDLTLTGRDCGLSERAPMCGIPFHASDVYISKLVSMGEKVAICEQLTEATGGKDLVVRDVIKVVTAGTLTNNELIDEKSNNFLCCVYVNKDQVSVSWVDITTGEFFTRSFNGEDSYSQLLDNLVKIAPAEIICNDFARELFQELPLVVHGVLPKFNSFTNSEFDFHVALEVVKKQLNVINLTSFSFGDDKACVISSGALISYVNQTQKHALSIISAIKYENNESILMLDVNAVRNLELTKTLRDGKRYGSLLWLLDKTKTSMGARKLQSWILSPLNSIDKINYRLDAVESLFLNTPTRQSLIDILSSVRDVGRIAGKISNGNLMPKDCIALKNSLANIPSIKFQLSGLNSKFLADILCDLGDFGSIVSLIDNAINDEPPTNIKDGGYIKEGFDNELDELRSLSKNSKACIAEIENKEREATGIKTLKVGYNRVFGYYIEITNSLKDKAPYYYQRRQTLANAERFITDELKEIEVKILSAEEKSLQLEAKLFNVVKDALADKLSELKDCAEAIANLDVLLSLATIAKENDYVKPTIYDGDKQLNIVAGRHPVVETISKQRFIPNDCVLDNQDNRTMIITGPNMAGKSTYMRQIAIIVLMAHMGSFVPAKSANISLTDKIFTRIGASDNLISDQSTFMVEMSEMASIINNATQKSLLILDEIGRGTSTYDGLSIAWAVVDYITNRIKAKTLFATHYHELTELEGKISGIKNYKVTVKEVQGGIVFLRKIMRGGTNRSFGIEVAELAGVSKIVTDKAKQILKELERAGVGKSKLVENSENIAPTQSLSEIERIVKDINIDNVSPMQAFNILADLCEKVKDKDE